MTLISDHKDRRLAAIMFTDIVGYSALMQRDEQQAVKMRSRHREVFKEHHHTYHGEVIQYYGDGTLSIFKSAIEATECAIAIQRSLRQGEIVPLRIGLHLGDIVFDGTEVFGDGVNVASRIERLAVAGSILISQHLGQELYNHSQIQTKSLGEFDLKNISNPVEIFAVTNEGIAVPDENQLKNKKRVAQSKTIAVLPFVNMSANEDNEYFSDGITEEIINALSKIKELEVTSRTSSFYYKNKNIPINEIGEALQVSTILEGSVRLSGNMMRITAQLISAANDYHFWSETWDRKLENIFAIQDEISLLIAERLREHVGHFNIQKRLVHEQTTIIEAYENYLKGLYLYFKWNQRDVGLAIQCFEKAIELDNNHAESYIALAGCHTFLASSGFMSVAIGFMKAKEYADKAMLINDQLPSLYYVLGGISFWFDWDFEKAFSYFEHLLNLNSNHAETHHALAMLYMIMSKHEMAIKHIHFAHNLDPLSPNIKFTEAWIYYMMEDYFKALELCRDVLEKMPASVPARIIYSTALNLTGRQSEVIDYFESEAHPSIDISTKLGLLAIAYAFDGDQINGVKYHKLLSDQLDTEHGDRAVAFISIYLAVIGETKDSVELIRNGYERRSPMILFLMDDPILKSVRGDIIFQDIRAKLFGAKNALEQKNHTTRTKVKTRKPLFDTATSDQYAQELRAIMKDEKPFLEYHLTLKTLADSLSLNSNQLSWLLNEHFGVSFNDFVNQHRLETFKGLAIDPKNAHLTLMGLAYDSGFNSKTVFNTFFKKMTGLTPKKWVDSVIKK